MGKVKFDLVVDASNVPKEASRTVGIDGFCSLEWAEFKVDDYFIDQLGGISNHGNLAYDYLEDYMTGEETPAYVNLFIKSKKIHHFSDFFCISLYDFAYWYKRFSADEIAGWITKQDAFNYKKKGIIPDIEDIYLYARDIADNEVFEDYDFTELNVGNISPLGQIKSHLEDNCISANFDAYLVISYTYDK